MKGSRHPCRPTDPTNKKRMGEEEIGIQKMGRESQKNKGNLCTKKQSNSRDFMVNFRTHQNFSLV